MCLQECDYVSRLFIYSKHFKPEDCVEPNATKCGGKLRLKPNDFPSVSVPNKINVTTEILRDSAVEETIMDATVTTPESSLIVVVEPSCIYEKGADNVVPSTPKRRRCLEPRYVGEIRTPDLATSKKTKRALNIAKRQINQLKLKNRALERGTRRLKKKNFA